MRRKIGLARAALAALSFVVLILAVGKCGRDPAQPRVVMVVVTAAPEPVSSYRPTENALAWTPEPTVAVHQHLGSGRNS